MYKKDMYKKDMYKKKQERHKCTVLPIVNAKDNIIAQAAFGHAPTFTEMF